VGRPRTPLRREEEQAAQAAADKAGNGVALGVELQSLPGRLVWRERNQLGGRGADRSHRTLAQAAILKDAHPSLPVFVYTAFGWAFGMNDEVWPLMADPQYRDFFLQSNDSFEFTRTNCQQMHTDDKHCVGYFWNFANASAREYFINKLVRPLALAPAISGVFFDAFNYAYDIPEVRPWNKAVTNIPNCSIPATPGGPPGWGGCEVLLNGTLEVARRTAALLNAHGKLPIFANPASFARPPNRHIWLDEARLVGAMRGLRWLTYYESFRGDTPSTSLSDALPNMLRESSRGVAAMVHTYYHKDDEDPTPHLAAFMLARSDHWFYLGSTGWWDNSYRWTSMYDALNKCGAPRGPAVNHTAEHRLTRAFAGCTVTLDCSNVTACVGDIAFSSSRLRALSL